MKKIIILAALALTGCETMNAQHIKPLIEFNHVSHALQHIDKDVTTWRCSPHCGYNLYSLGARWRPLPGLSIDLLEGYTKDQLDGQTEVFNGRMSWEIGAR